MKTLGSLLIIAITSTAAFLSIIELNNGSFEKNCFEKNGTVTKFFNEFLPDEGYGEAPEIVNRGLIGDECSIVVKKDGVIESYFVTEKKDGRRYDEPNYLGTMGELTALVR